MEPDILTCSNCATTILEAEAKDAGWRYWSDGRPPVTLVDGRLVGDTVPETRCLPLAAA